MHDGSGPSSTEVRKDFSLIEKGGNFYLRPGLMNEQIVDEADRLNLVAGAGDENYAIRLDALMLALR